MITSCLNRVKFGSFPTYLVPKMISQCSRLLLAIRGKPISLFCKRAISSPAMTDVRFDGKKVLVTGAGKGIGRILTKKLVDAGAYVIAVSRTQSDLESLKYHNPTKIQTLCLDLSKWKQTKTAITGIGPVDLLVNNAGVTDAALLKELGDITEEDVDRIFNTNVKAIINVTQIVAKEMIGGKGAIVNISCVIAERGAPLSSIYCASKGAVDQLTRAMAVEYGPRKIRVNSVNPTTVRTSIYEKAGMFDPDSQAANSLRLRTPLQRLAEPEDVVGPVFFLLSDHAAMVTGVSLSIDGGISVCFL